MSLQSMLSIARSALFTHQRAMDVTSHNIANVNTPGYSRQRLVLTPATPLVEPLYTIGRGVDAVALQRSRDTFYDAAYRRDNGMLGFATGKRDYLSQIESSLNEPSDDKIKLRFPHPSSNSKSPSSMRNFVSSSWVPTIVAIVHSPSGGGE